MPPVKTGVEAFWDNADFLKGLNQFTQGLVKASQTVSGQAAPAQRQYSDASGQATNSMTLQTAAGVFLGNMYTKVAEALGQLIQKTGEYISSATLTAARVQELTLVAQLLGQRAGFTADQINEQTQAIKDLGIQTDVALGLQAQFARYNLNMAQATDLARVAQDAAVLSMENSSDALDGLMYGIVTYNQRILRTHGINLDVSKSFDTYAATLGKTADQLTEAEKVQATLNGVIAQGANIAGVYATAMETPGKQARSLARVFYELKVAIGTPFLNAFGNLVGAASDLGKAFTKAFSEGGKLYPLLTTIGAIADLVTGGIRRLADALSNWLTDAGEETSNTFTDLASRAFNWGANIAIQLATGLIQGAASAITAALNWISQLLTSWLKPGSPPKIIPNIDKYGAAAMDEYLKGFSMADFNALDAIQNQMRQVFSTLVDQGKLAKDQMGPLFASLSKDIIKAMESGNVNGALFNKIREAGGKYGDELADLAKKQIALSQAEKQVTAAEKELDAARQRQAAAGKQVNALTMEYNRMLRGGATKAELAAQKAKIDAAAKARDDAAKEADAAQEKLDSAKANVDVLKEQAQLQSEILQQLLELAQAQLPPSETPGGGGGGGQVPGGGGLPPIPSGEPPDLSGVQDAFSEAVDNIRNNIIDKLKDVWQQLTDIWKAKMGPTLDQLKAAWERFKIAVAPITDFLRQKWQGFLTWLQGAIPNLLRGLQNWWAQHGQSVLTILGFFWQNVVNTATNIWETLKYIWETYGGDIVKIAQDAWDLISYGLSNLFEVIGLELDLFAALIEGDWSAAWEAIKGITEIVWQEIQLFYTLVWDLLKLAWKMLLDYLEWYWTTMWNNVKTIASTIWETIKTTFNQFLEDIRSAAEDVWTKIQQKADEIWTAIKDKIIEIIKSLFEWMGLNFDEQKAWFNQTMADIELIVNTAWDRIKSYAEDVWGKIKDSALNYWADITGWIKTAVTDVQTWLSDRWDEIKTTAETVWNTIKDTLSGIAQGIIDAIEGILGGLTGPGGTMSGFVDDMVQAGKDLIQGLIDGAGKMAGALVKAMEGIINDAIAALKRSLGLASPSKVMMNIGFNTVKGLEQGIALNANLPKNAMADVLNRMIPAAPVPVFNGPTYQNLNMTFNNRLSSQMDILTLQRLIIKTVREEIRK